MGLKGGKEGVVRTIYIYIYIYIIYIYKLYHVIDRYRYVLLYVLHTHPALLGFEYTL